MPLPTGPGQSTIINGISYVSAQVGNHWYWRIPEPQNSVVVYGVDGEVTYYPFYQDNDQARGDALGAALASTVDYDIVDLGDHRYDLQTPSGWSVNGRQYLRLTGGRICRTPGTNYSLMMEFDTCQNLTIDGLEFDGEADITAPQADPPVLIRTNPNEPGTNFSYMMKLTACKDTTIINTRYKQHASDEWLSGGWPQYREAMGIYIDIGSTNTKVQACHFSKVGYAGVAQYGDNTQILSSRFDDTQWHGITWRAQNGTVNDCWFGRSYFTTLGYQGGIDVSVSNPVAYPVKNVTVSDCQWDFPYDNPTPHQDGGMFCIKVGDCERLDILNTRFNHGKNFHGTGLSRDTIRSERDAVGIINIENCWMSGAVGGIDANPARRVGKLIIKNSFVNMGTIADDEGGADIAVRLACDEMQFENSFFRYKVCGIKGYDETSKHLLGRCGSVRGCQFDSTDTQNAFAIKGDYLQNVPEMVEWRENQISNNGVMVTPDVGQTVNFRNNISDTEFGRLCCSTGAEPHHKLHRNDLAPDYTHGPKSAITGPRKMLETQVNVPYALPDANIDLEKSNFQTLIMGQAETLGVTPTPTEDHVGTEIRLLVDAQGTHALSIPGAWDPAGAYEQPASDPFMLEFEIVDIDGLGNYQPLLKTAQGGSGGGGPDTSITSGVLAVATDDRSADFGSFDLTMQNITEFMLYSTGPSEIKSDSALTLRSNVVQIKEDASRASLTFYENPSNGAQAVTLAAPDAMDAFITVTLWDVLPAMDSFTMMDAGGNLTQQDPRGMDLLYWQYRWAGGNTYYRGDMVLDEGWLMVANKETTDKAAPQTLGSPYSILPEVPAWTTSSSSTSSLITGNQVTFSEPKELTSYTLHFPGPGTYRAVITDVTNPADPRLEVGADLRPSAAGSFTVPVGGRIYPAGTILEFGIQNITEGTPDVDTGNWNYEQTNNTATPAVGAIAHRTDFSFLIHKTDNDAGDRSALLAILTTGDSVSIGGQVWTIQSNTDNGAYHTLTLDPSIRVAEGVQTVTFTQPPDGQLDYVTIIGHWPGNTPAGLTISGFHILADGTRADNTNAYGMDILLEDLLLSPDWDFASAPSGAIGSSGGGGGGGAVDSVFGRSGDVIAANGDYNAGQITVTAGNGLDAVEAQAAFAEHQTDINSINTTIGTIQTDITNLQAYDTTQDAYAVNTTSPILGGAAISTSPTLTFTITGLTPLGAEAAADDEFILWDTSAGAFRKCRGDQLPGGGGSSGGGYEEAATKAARPDPSGLEDGHLVFVQSNQVEYRVISGAYTIANSGTTGNDALQASIKNSGDAEVNQTFFNSQSGGSYFWDTDDWSEVATN